MKRIIENYCWECEGRTNWQYQGWQTLRLERGVPVKRRMFRCDECEGYATIRTLKLMKQTGAERQMWEDELE